MAKITKQSQAKRRAARVRAKVFGTALRPRLSVSASLTGLFAQIIDDQAGKTLVSGRSHKLKGSKMEQAAALGQALAEAAKAAGITTVVFDRGPKQYHGRLKALAEALRAHGLVF